jgi:hypothetical protein
MTDNTDVDPAGVPVATAEFLTAKRDTGTASAFPEDFVVLEDTGVKVRVRGLSRHEVLHVQAQKSVAEVEQVTLSLGLIEPRLTVEQVKAWQKSSVGGEMEPVTKRIGELSGMAKGARKKAIKELLDDPGAEFRVHAGDEAIDDGESAPDGDE